MAADGSNNDGWSVRAAFGLGGLTLSGVIIYTVLSVFGTKGGGFGGVALLILVGIAAFLAFIVFMTYTAKANDIIDPKQPFGLPEGSVRAILTIAFIVIVGVLSSYLITSSDSRPSFSAQYITLLQGVTLDKASDVQKNYPPTEGVISIVKMDGADSAVVQSTGDAPLTSPPGGSPASTSPADGSPPGGSPPAANAPAGPVQGGAAPGRNPPGGAAPGGTTQGAVAPAPGGKTSGGTAPGGAAPGGPAQGGARMAQPLYEVRLYPRVDHHLADDISKQILTMLSTILAAMIGFYFGATPAAGGRQPQPGGRGDPRAPLAPKTAALIKDAPAAADLNARADQLMSRGPAAQTELKDLKVRANEAQKIVEAAQAMLDSGTTTDQQFKDAEPGLEKAVHDLKAIDQRLTEIDKAHPAADGPDSAAADRSNAAKRIADAVKAASVAPLDNLEKRVTDLMNASPQGSAEHKQHETTLDRIKAAATTLSTAEAQSKADSTTAADMSKAADAAQAALDELKSIEKQLAE